MLAAQFLNPALEQEYTVAEHELSMEGLEKKNPAPQGSTWQLLFQP